MTDTNNVVHRLQLSQQLWGLAQLLHCLRHNLIHNGLCRFFLIYHGCNFTHQKWLSLIQRVVVQLIGLIKLFNVVLHGNSTLSCQRLNFITAILFPIFDVRVSADAKWTTLDDWTLLVQNSTWTRVGQLTVKTTVRMVSSYPAVRTAS